ncbi:hypothetical protein JTB14_009480 [Gonioctena quinquepunctata]|nr:hypothetical protein JTB14_009480 [Gonioctena quinquepunctata]
MKIFLYLFSLCTFFELNESSCEEDWPNCDSVQNIVCETNCQTKSALYILTSDEKFRRWILDEHNKLRSNVAQGNETSGGNGEAANMMALSYEVELEYLAGCVARSNNELNECRRTKKYFTGLNDATATMNIPPGDVDLPSILQNAFNTWSKQAPKAKKDVIGAFYPSDDYAYYTQLVWAETTSVGCARTLIRYFSKDVNYYNIRLVCNYGSSGNIIGQPVYVKGTQCSKCPAGIPCNKKYKGLCGEIDEADLTKAPQIPVYSGGRLECPHSVSLGVSLVLVSLKSFDSHIL